jgi:hypothetical protein
VKRARGKPSQEGAVVSGISQRGSPTKTALAMSMTKAATLAGLPPTEGRLYRKLGVDSDLSHSFLTSRTRP